MFRFTLLALLAGSLAAPLALADETAPTKEDLQQRNRELEQRVKELEASSLEEAIESYLQTRPDPDGIFPGGLALRVSGQIRVRGELRDGLYAPSDPDGEESFFLTRLRTRVRFDLDVSENLAAVVELQDVRLFGEEGSTTADTEGVDIKRAIISIKEAFGKPVQVDLGRFVLHYGDQRLVGHLEWVDQGRSYDGLRLLIRPERGFLDLFAVQVRETQAAGDDQWFLGAYGGLGDFEAYLLVLGDDLRTAGETGTGHTRFVTLGGRFHTECGPWDATAEVAFQVGDHSGDDLSAFAFAVVGGHTFEELAWKPRAGIEVAYASGDSDPTDGDNGRFQTLFPTNHLHYGYADLVGWSNILNLRVRVTAQPRESVTISVDYHHFRRVSRQDAWVNAAGAVIRPGLAGSSRHLGDEVDLTLTWKARPALTILLGYSLFVPGGFVEQTGDDPLAHFLYLQALLKF